MNSLSVRTRNFNENVFRLRSNPPEIVRIDHRGEREDIVSAIDEYGPCFKLGNDFSIFCSLRMVLDYVSETLFILRSYGSEGDYVGIGARVREWRLYPVGLIDVY